jgi:phage replication O-like protein O
MRPVRRPNAGGTTPFPNQLLDGAMPHLTDTEWRVLCVVVRQTFGWQKRSDWLSHAQLKRRTGRQSAAISRAIDRLVRAGLLTVTDRFGRPLGTSEMRRRSHDRLVFSLPLTRSRFFLHFLLDRSSRSENDNRKTDKRKQQQGHRSPVV